MFWLCPFFLLSILYIDMSFLVSRFTVLFQIPTPHQNDYIITISSSNIIMTQMTLLTPICGRLVTLMVTVLHPSLEFCHVILLSTLSLGLAKEYYQKKKKWPKQKRKKYLLFFALPLLFCHHHENMQRLSYWRIRYKLRVEGPKSVQLRPS